MADDTSPSAQRAAPQTRLLLVDDHEVVRAGLRTLLDLEVDLDVVGEAASGEAAVVQARRLRPDVVLLDVVMEGLGGVEACRTLRSLPQPPRVLMLTSYSDDDAVISSILAGASGYLLKNTSRAELLRAIRAVAAGQELIDPSVTGKVTRRLAQLARTPEPLPDPLSEREREVLALIRRPPRQPHSRQAGPVAAQRGRRLRCSQAPRRPGRRSGMMCRTKPMASGA
jgi:DNA-binding NarL/FixJ family response regulator